MTAPGHHIRRILRAADQLAEHLWTSSDDALVAAAVAAATHFPAGDVRAVIGWHDTDTGEPHLLDTPVLWFDADGSPIVLNPARGLVTLRPSSRKPCAVYHPSAIYPDDHEHADPKAYAVRYVRDLLARQDATA